MEQETVKQVGVHFGMLCDPLAEQLKSQGLKFDPEKVACFQEKMEAVDTLRIGGYLVDSAADKVRVKIHKAIVAHVAKCEKLKVKK